MGADVDVLGTALGADGGGDPVDVQPIETGEDTPFIPEGDGGEPSGGESGEDSPIESAGAQGGDKDLPPWEEVKEVVPKSVYQAAKFLRAEHPEHAPAIRELVNAFGRLEGHKGVYATVEAARADQAILASFGGYDGISKLQEVQERAAEVDDMVDRGDPEVIRQMAEASPDGFARLVPEALERLERLNPEAYRQALLSPTLTMFDRAGLPNALRNAMEELKSGTPDGIARAGRWIEDTQRWLASMKQEHDHTQNQYKDPRITEFQKQQQTFQHKTRTEFYNEVDRQMNDHMRNTIRPELARRAAGRNIGKAALDDMEAAAMRRIREGLSKNNLFVSGVKGFARSGNRDGALTFVKPQIDLIRFNAIKEEWNTRYGSAPVKQAPTSRTVSQDPIVPQRGVGSSVQTPVSVRTRPPVSELDMTKDPNQLNLIAGRGFHKASGKWITWKPGRAR